MHYEQTVRASPSWRTKTGSECAARSARSSSNPIARAIPFSIPSSTYMLARMTKCVKVLRAKAKAKSMDQSQARIWVGTV